MYWYWPEPPPTGIRLWMLRFAFGCALIAWLALIAIAIAVVVGLLLDAGRSLL